MDEQPPLPQKRKPGRPRAAVPGVPVGTWLRAPEYDRLLRLAKQHDTSVSAIVRRLIRRGARQGETK